MRVRCSVGFWSIGAIAFLAGCRSDISGSYLAGDPTSVCSLQIVRTPDARLTGQLSCSSVKPDGSISRQSSSITGAVDGENVSFSGEGLFGIKSFVLSGVHHCDTMTLSSG